MAVWQWLPFTVTPKRTALPKKVSVIKTKKKWKTYTALNASAPKCNIYTTPDFISREMYKRCLVPKEGNQIFNRCPTQIFPPHPFPKVYGHL